MRDRSESRCRPLTALSVGWLVLVAMPLLGADDAAGRTDSELFYYFLALALWVLVAVLAVLAWPYYLWLRWRRRRKEAAKAEKSRQPVAEDAHSTEKKARQIGAPREDHKA